MEYAFSKRLDHFQTGIFATLTQKQRELMAQGREVHALYVGTPDFKASKRFTDAVAQSASNPDNIKYALLDKPELLEAVVEYYAKRFGVAIETDQITSVNGSQDGICHLGMTLCDPQDVVLLPDPGYPVFEASAHFAGAEIVYYPLLKENHFLPDFTKIDEEILKRTRYMIVSYPSNPCGAIAPKEAYEEWISYALKYNFYLINDNAYSDIVFDGNEGFSFLSLPRAQEVGVEFFSLSKSFNTTGARISFCIGNRAIVNALKVIRSQYDFGMFKPIQDGAIAVLRGPLDEVKEQCMKYQKRRDALCGGLRRIGWEVPDSQGTMFVWCPIPKKYTDTMAFWNDLVEKTGIIGTPGTAFGQAGEGYIRFALVKPEEELSRLVQIIDDSGILK